jgi:hypothetical protein
MMENSALLELENDIKNSQDEAMPHYIINTMMHSMTGLLALHRGLVFDLMSPHFFCAAAYG